MRNHQSDSLKVAKHGSTGIRSRKFSGSTLIT